MLKQNRHIKKIIPTYEVQYLHFNILYELINKTSTNQEDDEINYSKMSLQNTQVKRPLVKPSMLFRTFKCKELEKQRRLCGNSDWP